MIFGKGKESLALSPAAEVGDGTREHWSCPRQRRILDVFSLCHKTGMIFVLNSVSFKNNVSNYEHIKPVEHYGTLYDRQVYFQH